MWSGARDAGTASAHGPCGGEGMDRIAPGQARLPHASFLEIAVRVALLASFVGCGEKPAASSQANQGETGVATGGMAFGPQDYVRRPGAPVVVTSTFRLLNPLANAYTLHIGNGGARGQFDLVSSAVVVVNGEVVVTPQDFSQRVAAIDKSVRLLNENTLTVEVRSAPGSGFTLQLANHAPVANAGADQTVRVGQTARLQGNLSSDVDGGALAYRWTLVTVPPGSQAVLSDPASIQPTFVVDRPGTYVAALTVNDGQLDSAPDIVQLATPNSSPMANAGPDQSVAVGQIVTLDGSRSSDADGDSLTFFWSFAAKPPGSTATLSSDKTSQPTFVVDVPGIYVAQLIVNDGQIDSDPAEVTISAIQVDTRPPDLRLDPPDGALRNTAVLRLTITYGDDASGVDPGSLRVEIDGKDATGLFAVTATSAAGVATLSDGLHRLAVTLQDRAGNTTQATSQFTIDTVSPAPVNLLLVSVGPVTEGQVGITGAAGSVEANAHVRLVNARTGQTVIASATASGGFTATVAAKTSDGVTLTAEDAAGNTSIPTVVTVGGTLPPDPATVAPPLDRSVATDLLTSSRFLYTGTNPIQTGVEPDAIDPRRVAVLRGMVMTRDGQPLPGVSISVHRQPGLGHTLSRADGRFDLVVNGGGALVIDYLMSGYLAVQRQVQAPLQDYAVIHDVAMIPVDSQVTSIDLSASQSMQVARGSPSTDADGTRQATLLFPSGTAAIMVFPDASTQPLSFLSVRATEYTVGPNGPSAMSAELPPTSGYTYALEFSVDEAKLVGAIDVRFSRPLPLYVENFVNFPVGTAVPLGTYDRDAGVWLAEDTGRVIRILAVTDGRASLDLDGDGIADAGDALGITDAERERLATLYTPGQSLWRVLIRHFDQTRDCNWDPMPPNDSEFPGRDPQTDAPPDEQCSTQGSIIGCQGQVLGEVLGVVGTEFTLHYQSERTPGRNEAYRVSIPLSDAIVPPSLRRIELEISVAGQFHKKSFAPTTNQQTSFVWDGKNAYGQVLQGQQPITVRIGYTYPGVYGASARFGSAATDAITGSRSRQEVTLWRTWRSRVGAFDARGVGLGGWTLSPHHTYSPLERVVYRGDGQRQSARTMPSIIGTVVGTGVCGVAGDGGLATQAQVCPAGLAFGADGSLYIVDPAIRRVRRVAPDGIITTVAGNSNNCSSGPCGDGGPAVLAQLSAPIAVAVGPDDSLYISEQRKVRKVDPDGIITTFAGTGTSGFGGDGGPATLAQLGTILSLAIAPDGSLYMADQGNFRIRRVGTDGIIETVAGTGVPGFSGDGGPATRAGLDNPRGIAVGQDGSLYIADNARVRRVTPDGVIRTIAGTGSVGFTGDGGPATEASFRLLSAVTVAPDDTLYLADTGNFRVRWMRPGGTINTIAGNGVSGTEGDGGPAREARLQDFDFGLAVAPDGGIYLSQTLNNTRVRRISPIASPLLAGGGNAFLVPSPDGSEVYRFSLAGQHLRTIDSLTGVVRYEFAYDGAGQLTSITDRNGNLTSIEHDGSGNPSAIAGPYGQRTAVAVNADGYLDHAASPAGAVAAMTYTATGLLSTFTNPRGQTSKYTYDGDGRLSTATDPTGATKSFARSGTPDDYTVTMTTALGRTTAYRVQELGNGDVRLTTTDPAGTQRTTLMGGDGVDTATLADGTTVRTVLAPDPRWGMLAPAAVSVTVTTPGGRVLTTANQRTVTLAAPNDPLSLTAQSETSTVNGRIFTTTFDAASRTVTGTSAAGRRVELLVDDRGRPVMSHFGDSEPIRVEYDAHGRPGSVTEGTRVARFSYGTDGFLASSTDAIGGTVSFARDADGRVVEQRLPDGRVVRFGHDLNGNLTALRPPGRPDHIFSYTPRDEIATYAPPPVGAESDDEQYSYDNDRQPLRLTRADGQGVQFQYDGAGRLAVLGMSSGDRGYAYDGAGRITSLSVPLSTLTFAYDGGLTTASVLNGDVAGSVTRTYDGDFRVSSHSVNGASPVAIQYDADGLAMQVGQMSLTRSAQSERITGTVIGSLSDTRSFDSFGNPAAYAASHGANALSAVEFRRDALGRLAGKTESVGGVTHVFAYTYDLAGRLTEVRQDGVSTESYTYDDNDNRLTGPDAAITYRYDVQDRLVQRSGPAPRDYASTPNGERQSKTTANGTTSYRYDSVGNLASVRLPSGAQIAYVLDAGGRRIGKRVDGTLVQALLYQDALRPIAELDGSGAVVSRFVYANGRSVPGYLMKGGATYRIVSDHLGSPRLVVDVATGQIAQRLDYDTFGNVTLDTNPGFQPFGFAGGLYDRDTQLVHFGAREYDPETGRWTAKDPIGFASGPNLYVYAGNDPVNLIDPLGTQEETTFPENLFEEEDTEVVDTDQIWENDVEYRLRRNAENARVAREEAQARRAADPRLRQLYERPRNYSLGRRKFVNESCPPRGRGGQRGVATAEANWLVVAFLFGYEYGTFLNNRFDMSGKSLDDGRGARAWAEANGADPGQALVVGAIVASQAAGVRTAYHVATAGSIGGWLIDKIW